MSTSTPARLVVNVDALWGADPRWYRIGDVSLGDRGVPQLVIFYAAAGVILGWLLTSLPVGVRFWPAGLIVTLVAAALGFVRPGGLRVHQFAPVAAAHLVAPRHLHGWHPCPSPEQQWRPGPLPMEGDGSRPQFEELAYTGPGLIVRHRPARHVRLRLRPHERLLGRRAGRQVLTPIPAAGCLTEGREVLVPAGVTVRVRRER
ncbi:hypothetical protein DSM112329_02939 [Paraconexibacter sp. AEG42_29]|uniref:Uncharacterized protein n=1 Tax=Paraconexibacter sp. AEG42_29 TaxID=2997339 RepID=A0AAU7AWN5_9ACTN